MRASLILLINCGDGVLYGPPPQDEDRPLTGFASSMPAVDAAQEELPIALDTPSSAPTGTSGVTGTTAPTTMAPPPDTAVTTSTMQVPDGISYKLYRQRDETLTNRRGIVLMGAGNDPGNPSVGSLDEGKGNRLCAIAADAGYVCATVGYRVPPADVTEWNDRAELMANDYLSVADDIIAHYGMSRARTVMGGMSYSTFMMLSSVGGTSTLAEIRGFIAGCGSSTWLYAVAAPVFGVACQGNHDMGAADPLHAELIKNITPAAVKADSGFFTDTACASHCGGNTNLWAEKMLERVQLWLP